jgi:DNA mismatch repair protein MutS
MPLWRRCVPRDTIFCMAATPMMQQYQEAKAACGDAILLFRMGDFYELFFEDARTAAQALGLTLTSRDKGENPIPMAGFPHHQMENYLGKLIARGFRVAICDQVEDPKKAKGLVRREVTRVVTPGTLTDDALLDPRECNYLAAVHVVDDNGGPFNFHRGIPAPPGGSMRPGATDGRIHFHGGRPGGAAARVGLAWVELSTGQFQATVLPPHRLADELARVSPSEVLVNENADPVEYERTVVADGVHVTRRPGWTFSTEGAVAELSKQFGTRGLEGFGFEDNDAPAVAAAGAILDYLRETQRASLDHIDGIRPWRSGSNLEIDEATRRSLEITRTLRDGSRQGTLLWVLDRTVTPMGSRMLAQWTANPLTDIDGIGARLDAVEEMIGDAALTADIRETLRGVYDLERLVARVVTGRASPRDLSFVGRTLARLPALKAKLTGRKSDLLQSLEAALDLCPDLRSKLEAALVDECPLVANNGGFIRPGFHQQLDELRELAGGGREWIARYQARAIEESGIPNLKVGFNKVFGYYLEVTHAHRDKVPESFIRKQTLKNAERYVTPELKEYEEKILVADENARELEYQLFLELRDTVQASGRRLRAIADVLARLDALISLAELARERNYCRPEVVAEPILDIRDGRHPVLDIVEPDGTFVPNDTRADPDSGQILLITGPNMSGKSTYIRQTALLTLMAQVGSFVPAASARIGVADRIFARVGASDELSRGQSTFMVEMIETARILNTATERSLVVLDEIGRGTSTYDGISLAWSIVEYLNDRIGCRTFFATHYHELTDLAGSLSSVRNLNVSVREWEDNVVFLHKIVDGAADKSYGIHVARLAGVPSEVNERAKQILAQLESEHLDESGRPKIARKAKERPRRDIQLTLFGPIEHPILDEIRRLDLERTTPMEAFELVRGWMAELEKESKKK